MIYRVEVEVKGVLRVEAESAEQAEKMARATTPTLQGKKLFGPKISAKTIGVAEEQKIEPDNVKQYFKSKVH